MKFTGRRGLGSETHSILTSSEVTRCYSFFFWSSLLVNWQNETFVLLKVSYWLKVIHLLLDNETWYQLCQFVGDESFTDVSWQCCDDVIKWRLAALPTLWQRYELLTLQIFYNVSFKLSQCRLSQYFRIL